jgi:tryptophan 2,3-dioxygenase
MAASEERGPMPEQPLEPEAATAQGVTYADYLALDRVLDAQHPIAPEDLGPGVHAAEHFFITVHQAFELWLKQELLDLRCAT